jgi:hypothetical protein
MDWERLFHCVDKEAPASDDDIAYLQESVLSPLTESEIAEINAGQSNPFPLSDPLHANYKPFDPSKWQIPRRRFPESFVEFLRWSNGGNFERGEWLFNMFPTSGIRDFLLAYQIPEYMPGAIPFAFDGAGGFYLFDMRDAPVDGEYPIVSAHAGDLGWEDDDRKLADTFLQAILSRVGELR